MGYIRATVDVDVDYDDIEDYEICNIVEDRLDDYERKVANSKDPVRVKKLYEEFKQDLTKAVDGRVWIHVSDKTLLDEMYEELFEQIRDKFSLGEVTNFLKSK